MSTNEKFGYYDGKTEIWQSARNQSGVIKERGATRFTRVAVLARETRKLLDTILVIILVGFLNKIFMDESKSRDITSNNT